MAEKKSISSSLTANAVARVKEQKAFTGSWGVAEHLSCLRYMAVDALRQSEKTLPILQKKEDERAVTEKRQPVKLTTVDAVNIALRDAFAADVELAYASNFQKLLIRSGELAVARGYE